MPYVVNISPFQAQAITHTFYNGKRFDCIFLKATLRLSHDGTLKPLIQQPGFVINDEDEAPELANWPEHPALRYPAEIAPYKPATDVIVIGHARPAKGEARERWLARVLIEGEIDQVVQLTGPRHWQHQRRGGWQLSPLTATDNVRLSYALAAGGGSDGAREHADDLYPANPFGRGFLGRTEADEHRTYPAPQILQPGETDPVWGQPGTPAGLSPVAGQQMARLQYAGTYDEAWKANVAPNIPLDMDLAFWNAAPPGQQVRPWLVGGETIHTEGLLPTADGIQTFTLPRYDIFVMPVRNGQKDEAREMNLDTIILDLDRRHVTLRWCALLAESHGFDEYQVVAYTENQQGRQQPRREDMR